MPTVFWRPPHGAIAGLALVDRKATQPARAAIRVKYSAVPKWLELRSATAADAVRLGAADRFAHGVGGQHLAHRIAAVDHRDGAGIDDEGRRGDRPLHTPALQPRQVPGQAQHAVRLVAPQVGLHQGISDEPGVRRAACRPSA